MIDRATVERIKDAADIVEVVSDYVSLTRRGSNFMGLCPFHNERTPSFSVNKARNFCYCFSCHKGGSPVNFIMEKEGISYHDALLQLAKKYNIKVEERELSDEEKQKQSVRESMFIANEWAMNYFSSNLYEKEEGKLIGLSYLKQRGVNEEAIKAFKLGYSIDSFDDYYKEAIQKGFNPETLKSIGLVGTSSNGKEFDRFKGRVMFPIFNPSGRTIAFGGRDLKGAPAKYINSPETEIYKKSSELYGLFQAKTAIVKEDRCYLVEGYLDVISMWQSGIKNVVASSGTALTDGQIALIHRFTKNVTLIYDGDNAGIKASLRGIDMLLSHHLDLKVLLLPDGEDPDSFSKKLSPEEFKKYIEENQTDIIKFKAKILMNEASTDPQKKLEAVRSIVSSLAHIPDKIKRDIYIQECGILMEIDPQIIVREVARQREIIISEEKQKRNRKEIQKEFPLTPGSSSTDNKIGGQENEELKHDRLRSQISAYENPLEPLEWKILEYCLKYGYLKILEPENETDDPVTVIEFINEELNLDNIEFSVNEYRDLFNSIKNGVESYRRALSNFYKKVLEKNEKIRKEKFEEIAEKGLSMSEIKREEEKLEEEILNLNRKEISEFSKNYCVREYASHENSSFRKLANQAYRQSHKLSNIFTRDGNKVESEEDKLLNLILTALNVWKNGILDIELKKQMNRLRELTTENNNEEIEKINLKILNLLQARSRMAKDIGERILSPR